MPKQIYLAYFNTLTFSCVQMILYTTIPYIAEKTGVITSNIIAAISIGSLIFSFMGPVWAAKSDKLGRNRVLSFGMIGMFLSFGLLSILFIYNESFPLTIKIGIVFLSRIIYGFLASAIVPVSQAWQLDLIPQTDRLKVLTRNSMCLNLGRILGPILILVQKVNFEIIVYLATTWVFLLAISTFLISSQASSSNTNREVSFKDLLKKWKINIKESALPILLALVFTAFIGILHSFLGHHLKTTLNISGKEATIMFAYIILLLSVLAIIFQQLSIYIFQSRWKPRVIIGPVTLVIGTFIMMNSTNSNQIWISIGFISIATAFIPPVYLALTSRSQENTDKTNVFGKKLGIASVAHSLGYALGAGLIALSMKMNLISTSFVVILVSLTILGIALLLIRNASHFDRLESKKV